MPHDALMIHIGKGFWNIRGSFKIGGVVNVGTHCSLVRLRDGDFVLLDAYTLEGDVLRQVMALTQDGKKLKAVLNLHPFHTIHVEAVAKMFPHARQYGTSRHHGKCKGVNWEPELTNQSACHELFADDFDFLVPDGVQFIADDSSVHFSSVIAIHKESGTMHVDDTLSWLDLPLVGGLSFHPTLKQALEDEQGAALAFRTWAQKLATRCADVQHLCTAHGAALPPSKTAGRKLSRDVLHALSRVESTLIAHEQKFQS